MELWWRRFRDCRQMMHRMTTTTHSCTFYPTMSFSSSRTGTRFSTIGKHTRQSRTSPPSLESRETTHQQAVPWCYPRQQPAVGHTRRFWSAAALSSGPSRIQVNSYLPVRRVAAFYPWRRTQHGWWRICRWDATWGTWFFFPPDRYSSSMALKTDPKDGDLQPTQSWIQFCTIQDSLLGLGFRPWPQPPSRECIILLRICFLMVASSSLVATPTNSILLRNRFPQNSESKPTLHPTSLKEQLNPPSCPPLPPSAMANPSPSLSLSVLCPAAWSSWISSVLLLSLTLMLR